MRSIPIRDHEWSVRGAPLDDAAMQQHIRSLALTLNPDGETAVRFCTRSAVRAPLIAAQSFPPENPAPCPALQWLLENGRLTESMLLSLRPSGGVPLPAFGGTARIQHIARELVRRGDGLTSRERLTGCLTAFDEVRSLTMAEIQTAPDALAAALCEEYLLIAAAAMESQKARQAAFRWLEEGAPIGPALARRGAAFFECALSQLRLRDLPAKYSELTEWLREHGRESERLISLEHERQALSRLILMNIMTSLRMLLALDWTEDFRRISRAEKTLLSDPAGTYPRMDDESRAQVRTRVCILARAASMAESTIAHLALEAAQKGEGIAREICWWLNTDAGTRQLLSENRIRARVRPLVPDPTGKTFLTAVLGLTALFFIPALLALGLSAALLSLPILGGTAAAVLHALLPHIVRPRPLMKLRLESVPDEFRTLIVLPALLSSPERAKALAEELETLGCLEQDKNLSYLLLGDLPEYREAQCEGDEATIRAAEEAVSAANARAGYEKYFFLHRPRAFQKCEGRWMGRERKRGALTALHRLLLHGENGFAQPAALRLAHRFTFILTLDAGTRMLPGTVQKMIGALAHPVNRLHREPDGRQTGYALLAPRMELPADAVINRFIELAGGRGGVDSYPTAVSDLWQDFCGQGMFGGKGIYDVAAFERAVQGRLPDNLILSHDLIEGILCRAGFLCDIALFEGHPKTVRSWLMRLNRWTRGDWQLLPLIFSKSLGLCAPDRFKLLDNLRRSLEPLAQTTLICLGFYAHSPAAVLTGLLPFLLPLLLHPRWTKDTFSHLLLRVSLLPQETWALLSAILRSLWRMTVTRRGLLQWVTSDDADRRGGALSPLPGWIASALLLPALIAPTPWLLTDVLLAALWWTGTALFEGLEQPFSDQPAIPQADRSLLHDLAERTFRFFEDVTSSTGLPPDNVQTDPPNGAANRTSPTNIGMYLAACVSARELGLISFEELTRRAGETLDSLERMEKWRGHIYNWHNTDTLEPLRPRYVSSVDSGNLAACLLMTARSLAREGADSPAARMEKLARGMDFVSLYDEKRNLFRIGVDVENDRPSASHYDLLASESRILSFTAMMLHQIPVKHWARLGRMAVPLSGGEALTSWSGTMFEYLMPALFMPACRGTLLHQTQQSVISAQIESGTALPGGEPLWGVSESGYYAFDSALNYQYRAFGLPALALRGDAQDGVIAPYASMLALPFAPEEALDNLRRMTALGLTDEHGLFEAADCSPDRIPAETSMRIVKSHMAHHQGMILCALCNALTDDALIRLFMDRPEARALILLLQEKPAPRIRLTARATRELPAVHPGASADFTRPGRPSQPVPDTHLLTGPGSMALIAADGSLFVRQGEILLNRRESDPSMPPQGLFVHARDLTSGESYLLSGMKHPPESLRLRVQFDAGSALFHTQTDRIDARLRALISPEDGAFLQEITLQNLTNAPIELEITSCFEPALAHEADYTAHPVFQNLFLESSLIRPGALCFTRRPRAAGQTDPALVHTVAGAQDASLSWETDLLRLSGRGGSLADPGSLPSPLSNTLGPVLTPCSALRVRLSLPVNAPKTVCFAAGLVREAEAAAFAARHTSLQAGARALELASTQSRELIRYLGLTPSLHHALHRAAVLMLFPRLHIKRPAHLPEEDYSVRRLWEAGVSGDLPILLAYVASASEAGPVRELIRAHEFYRSCGLMTDLVLIIEHETGYSRPVRDRLQALLGAGPLCASPGEKGGAHLLDASHLTGAQRAMFEAAAALIIYESRGSLTAQLHALLESVRPPCPLPAPIEPSDSLPALPLAAFNGFGGFSEEGYVIEKTPTPAPWCNFLCNPHFGAIITERGGGFIWRRNSRSGRITPFDNNPVQETSGDALFLRTPDGTLYSPSLSAARITHRPGASLFEGECRLFSWTETQFVDHELPVKCHHLMLTARKDAVLQLRARIDFLMNVARADGNLTAISFEQGALFARGTAGCAAFACLSLKDVRCEDGLLTASLSLRADEIQSVDLLIGADRDAEECRRVMLRFFDAGGGKARLQATLARWQERLTRITLHTPDEQLNRLVSTFLPCQTLCSRIMGRTGFYQPGGAFGFRDQLQDMLSLLLTDPDAVRSHLILCAGRQFQSGDVQHWWHPGEGGVRTRISDDMLFLPYVTAEYVETTGDRAILDSLIPFLKDVSIPDDREDWYGEAEPSEESAPLHEHCLRAIRRGLRIGRHGLLLMGSGDWNDGMNRVGHLGVGESVWLTEFAVVVLEKYAPLCDERTQQEFHEIAGRLREALEQNAWDGRWYIRAFMDDGRPIGSSATEGGCRIDSIAQSWAVLAGLSRERVKTAMNEVDRQLIDREHGLIRLLAPPFDGKSLDPGYIRGYPPGVRENGGQYTHAACWTVIALAALGYADRAWEAFRMLMPDVHSDSDEKALLYRVEPYVIAADVCSEDPHTGRGGWTWYTGAAGWAVRAAYIHLMGLVRRGDTVTLRALLPKDWSEAAVTLRIGRSTYTLTARRSCGSPLIDGMPMPPEGVRLIDDGKNHLAVFPPRR